MVPVLDFLTKHFLVLSTALTAILTASTFIFIASYLSVFDFSLIWIIEYADILKFVFISLGVASGLALSIFGLARMAILSFTGIKVNQILFFGFIIILLLGSMLEIFLNLHVEGRWHYTISILGCYLVCMYFVASIRQHILKWPIMSKWDLSVNVSMFIFGIYTFGTAYGLSVKFSGPNHNDVLIKDAQTLHDATIIMILSHHSIFLVDRAIVTVPSANVIRIVHATE